MSKRDREQVIISWLLLAFVLGPRLLSLQVFLTADEPLFLAHAREFARGLATGDPSLTLGIGYPGVTVAWWSAPAAATAATELSAYTAGRFVTAAMTGFLLLLLYRFSRLLLGRWPALVGVLLLALDPYSLAYSRLLHIAAPLALLMTLAGVSYLLWLREQNRRWLLLTGLFTGLALLTKSTALLLGPLFVLLLAGWYVGQVWDRKMTSDSREEIDRSKSKALAAHNSVDVSLFTSHAFSLLFIALLATLVFFALWPAMWTQPLEALNLTFGKLLTDQEAGAGNLGMFWLGRFVQDPGPAFYPLVFLLKATPWLLLGLGLSLWFLIEHRTTGRDGAGGAPGRNPDGSAGLPVIISLWLFALGYLLFMTLASKKSVRYMLPAFPSFYLLAGLAYYQVFSRWRASRPAAGPDQPSSRAGANRLTGQPARWLIALCLPILIFALFYHPYYFTYYNPLVLGWRWAPWATLVGWGEGLDQAADYLNRQPAVEGPVAAWYDWIFPLFYRGAVAPATPREKLITAGRTVLYVNQVQRDIPDPNVIHYFRARRRPEHTVRLAGIEYAWVYPGPIAGARPDVNPDYPLGGDFGAEVRLLGYDLGPAPVSGRPLIVTLYWQALASLRAERFVFVRLIDEAGHVWAGADSPPVMGLWPVGRWQPEMVVEDAQALPIPPGAPPGAYRLEVGWYDPASGEVLAASGQPIGPGGGLLLGQVTVGWQPYEGPADMPRQVEARLAPEVRLVGYDGLPSAATTGDILPLRLAWREAKPLFTWRTAPDYRVVFRWSPPAGQAGSVHSDQQADPLPWPVERWGRGALLLSQHDVIVPPGLPAGRRELVVSLAANGTDPADQSISLGVVEVTSPPHQFETPAAAAMPLDPGRLAGQVELVGYEIETGPPGAPTPESLDLTLYWRTDESLPNRYKVFVQLLTPDNDLAAQSDSFPAAGQRPTTGWLPREVIADPHTLPLPAGLPPGAYRLIAGLYHPGTGERLPLSDGENSPFSDAILVAEVNLP